MPNPFDELASVNQDAQNAATATATSNGFEELDQQREARRLRVVTSAGLVGDPTRAARIIAQQHRTALPADLIDRNLDEVEKQTRRKGFDPDAFRKTSPLVAAWLAKSPYNFQVAQDDLTRLAELEAATRDGAPITINDQGQVEELEQRGAKARTYKSIAHFLNEKDFEREARQAFRDEAFRDVGGSQFMAGLASAVESTYQMLGLSSKESQAYIRDLNEAAVQADPSVWGDLKRGAGGLTADIPLMLTGAPLAKGVGSVLRLARARAVLAPYLGKTGAKLATGAVQTMAANAPLAIREGITTGQEHGAINGVIAGLIESAIPAAFGKTGVERALIGGAAKDAGRGWLAASGRLLKDAGWEAADEMATELGHAVHEQFSGIDPNAMDLVRLTRRLFVAGVLGGGAGAGFNLPGVVGDKLHRDGMAAADSLSLRNRLQAMGTVSQASQVAKISPEAFDQLTQEITGDEATYFQSDDWKTALEAAGQDPAALAAELTGNPDAYRLALATGGTIKIPMGKLVAKLGTSEYFQGLSDHARPSPGGMSAIEAQKWAKEAPANAQQMAKDVRQTMTQVHGDEHAQRVYEDVRQKLVAAGQPEAAADHEAMLISAWHKVVAERYNRDAETPDAADPVNAWTTYTREGEPGKERTPALDIKQDTTIRIGQMGYDRQALATALETAIGDVLDVSGKAMTWAKDQQGNALVGAGYMKTVNAARWFQDSGLRGKGVLAIVEALRSGDAIDWSRNQATRYIAANAQKILAQHVERFGNAEQFKAITPEEETARIQALDDQGVMWQGGNAAAVRIPDLPPNTTTKQAKKAIKGWIRTAWLDQNGKPISVRNDATGHDIILYRSGINHVLGSATTPVEIQALRVLPDLIAKARLLSSEPEKRGNPEVVQVLKMASDASINGMPRTIKLTIKEYRGDRPGHRFYHLEALKDEAPATTSAARASSDRILPGTPDTGDGTAPITDPRDGSVIRPIAPGNGQATTFNQGRDTSPRGSIQFPPDGRSIITLFENRDRSTFLHETGHYFLNQLLTTAEGRYTSASVRADAAEVMKWLGIEDRQALATEHHERFARAFEQYLMEGKAPSASLMGAFRTFKRWLMTVYAAIRGDLKTGITPDIRRVFDRMLATDEEIAAAEHARGGEALYENAEQAGMDAATWAKYQEAVARTTQDARDRMERELIESDLAQQSRERAAVRTEIRSAVESRIDEDQNHLLISALQDGTSPDGTPMDDTIRGMKLDRSELIARYGQQAVDERLPGPNSAKNKGRSVAADKGGISLAAAAAIFGYPSGDDVWHALVDTPDRRQAIEHATDQEMAARFPDPLNDPALGQKAETAMHHELRGQLLAREIDSLSRQVPGAQAPHPIELLRAAAREQVMRTRAIDLNPHGFALAERRAAKAARDAIVAGDRATALAEKQRELLNHELYILAKEADDDVRVARQYFATFARPATRQRIGKAGGWEWTVTDPTTQQTFKATSEEDARRIAAQGEGRTWERTSGYLEQIDGILDGIEFAQVSRKGIRKRLMLSTWIAEQQAMGLEPAIAPELVTGASMRNWRLLTTQELLGVRDSIQSIEHLATLKNELLADAQKRTLDAAADAISGTVFKTSGGRVITRPQALRGIEGPGDAIARFAAAHRRLTDLVRNMDGHQDGGALFDLILRPLNQAADREATMQAQAIGHLDQLWKALGERRTGTPIDFRQRIHGASERVPALSTEERLGVALNWGNASNRQRLLTGHQWSEADVAAILDTLSKAEWDYVQGVWDHINSYWSEIKAQEQRLTGVAPPKIEATPIFTKHGKYRGGYFPAKYDQTQSASASQHVLEGMFREAATGQPTTRHGFTKDRELAIEPGVKLRLDHGVIREHVTEVIHDLTHRATLIDAARILRHKAVRDSISTHYGVDQWAAIRDTLMAVAKGDQAAQWGLNKAFNWMRAGGSVSAFAYNATSALSQITGIAQSAERLGLKWMMTGIKRTMEDPMGIHEQIVAKSEFMANRARTFNRDIRELGSLNLQEKGKFYWMIAKMQQAVDTPTWLGAYEKARSEGHDDAMAVSIADQTVVDTQGGGRIHDLAPIMRGGPLAKLFTQLASFPNVAANLLANSAQRNAVLSARFAGSAATLILLQAVSTWALKALMKGDWPDDGEELAKKLAKDNAAFMLGMVVGGRELSGPILEGRAWTGPAGTRGIEALGRLAIQSEQGDMDRQLERALVDSVGIFGHLPSVAAWRIIDGLIAPGDRDRSLRAALFGRPAKKP